MSRELDRVEQGLNVVNVRVALLRGGVYGGRLLAKRIPVRPDFGIVIF